MLCRLCDPYLTYLINNLPTYGYAKEWYMKNYPKQNEIFKLLDISFFYLILQVIDFYS